MGVPCLAEHGIHETCQGGCGWDVSLMPRRYRKSDEVVVHPIEAYFEGSFKLDY